MQVGVNADCLRDSSSFHTFHTVARNVGIDDKNMEKFSPCPFFARLAIARALLLVTNCLVRERAIIPISKVQPYHRSTNFVRGGIPLSHKCPVGLGF